MRHWKTTVLGILGAAVVYATSRGYITQDLATFIGTALVALFGAVSADGDVQSVIGGGRPDDRK